MSFLSELFKPRITRLREELLETETDLCLRVTTQRPCHYFWLSRDGELQAFNVWLEQLDPNAVHIPKDLGDVRAVNMRGSHLVNRIKGCVAFMNAQNFGGNDVVKLYQNREENWYMGKISCDREGYITLFSDKLMCWVDIPHQLIDDLRGGEEDRGTIYPHPYSMEVVDWANLRKPSTNIKPMLEFVDEEDPTQATYNALVAVPGIPGLHDHLSKKVIFNLTVLDDSSLPIFDIIEVGEAIKYMEHETPEYTLDLNKLWIRFGKNPNPVKVQDLITSFPNHRFICSDTPNRRNKEKYVDVNTIPKTYP